MGRDAHLQTALVRPPARQRVRDRRDHWILRAGADPAAYLDRHQDRFPLFHLKDGTPTEGIETDLGEGTVDFPAILSHLRNLGSHDFAIERDQQPDPVRTAHVSYDYLRSIRVPRAC